MYNSHFGLSEAPFSISPDPRYLFMSPRHREALAHLLYGLRVDGGFVLLTGEVGTGKTTLCRCLLEQVPEHCEIAFIFNPKVNPQELLHTLCDELHVELPAGLQGLKPLVDRLNAHLLASHARGRKTVLIVDEAQNLSNDVLELLRLLTNLETSERKLLQIILLGQPELRERLAETPMRQLAQRIVARYHLETLSCEEVGAYVQHRLAVAGARGPSLFAPALLKRLYRLSGGTPRLINLICDRALLGAYVRGRDTVDITTLKQAAREVLGEACGDARPARLRPALSGILAVATLAAVAVAVQRALPLSAPAAPPAPMQAERLDPVPEPHALPLRIELLADRATALEHEPHRDEAEASASPPADSEPTAGGATALAEDAKAADQPPLASPLTAPASPPSDEPAAIAGPAPEEHWLHEVMAVRSLFARLQVEVAEPTTLEEACRRADQLELHCLAMHDDLDALRAFDSPAIVELRQSDGPDFLAALLAIGPQRVRLAVAGKTLEVPLDSLTRQWTGRYTLLWRAPQSWVRGFRVGARDPLVAWIDQRLARWEGRAVQGSDLYGAELAERVRSFQQTLGLQADGVVGRLTLSRLVELTAPATPALAQQGY